MELIATLPPYVSHINKIIAEPLVSALRFNSIMPIGESKKEVLQSLLNKCKEKPLYLDIKFRQLRIKSFSYLPYAYIRLNHSIEVDLPADIYFKNCKSTIVYIMNGCNLILSERPENVVGEGQPVNILDKSLKINETFTEDDLEYIEEWIKLGQHRYMLSFTENIDDINELLKLDSKAYIIAKIESKRGMDFVKNNPYYSSYNLNLMAARDDLFINMGEHKFDIIEALQSIVFKDRNAIVASKIFTSLEKSEIVSLSDISDFYLMNQMGYKRFMLSDEISFLYNGVVFDRVISQIKQHIDISN